MKLISLKYDYAFRELFSHEGIRKQFISDVTGIPLEDIKTVRLTTPFLWKRYQKQKQGILAGKKSILSDQNVYRRFKGGTAL